MVQAIGVDGFRIDAAKHVPEWVLDYIDQAVFRASPRMNFDGTIQPVFMFSEVLDGNKGLVQSYIRKDLPNPLGISPSNTTVAGNRDALDFPLFYAMRDNLSGNGFQNNWHHIRNASQDTQDDGIRNGSQGVAFVDSHDNLGGGFPFLKDVAYAYILMRPGNALVYLNAKEFGENRDFPNDGKDDALGGFHGDTISTLVELRNTHGRGNFQERWIDDAYNPNGFSNIYVYERENSAIVGLNSRLDIGYDQRTPVQTGFAPDTVLVELTGNSTDPLVDPDGNIPETIRVDGSGRVTLAIPRNGYLDIGDPGDPMDDQVKVHGKGYVVYGVPGPQGTLSLSGVSSTLQGASPTAATNGTARLADIDVIRGNSFGVRLDTTPVTLPAVTTDSVPMPVRDFDADGDAARIRVDGGMNLNNLPGVDVTNPADVSYGFEQFTDTNAPGFTNGGVGVYQQQVDATQLAEGRHYVTVRAFRHRAGGPAVFTDFKRTIYVDRLPPEAAVVSFDPYATSPNNPNNRDLIVESTDQTADNMHIFLDLPSGITNATVLLMALNGQNDAGEYDRDKWIYGFPNVATGNHVATVVTFEPTYDGVHGFNVQRFAGLFTDTNIGAGFGDSNSNGIYEAADISGAGGFEQVLYSQNNQFNASADVTADGLVDNRDLFALGAELIAGGASSAVLAAYDGALQHRADLNQNGTTNSADFEALYAHFGPATWLFDLNVDGVVNALDAETFVTQLLRTVPGDFNVDGVVDAADYTMWRDRVGQRNVGLIADGDFDGDVDDDDYLVWKAAYGFHRGMFGAGAVAGAAAPEPSSLALVAAVLAAACAGIWWPRFRSRFVV